MFLIFGFFLISNQSNPKSQNFKTPKDETLSTSIENSEKQSQISSDEDPFEVTVLRQQSIILEKLIQLNKISLVEQLLPKLPPSTYLFSLLMKGYVRSNDFAKAQELLKKMEESEGFRPNNVTYNTFVQCAMQAGKVEEAKEVFVRMPERDIITFSIYISGLFERDLVKEAMQVYQQVISEK